MNMLIIAIIINCDYSNYIWLQLVAFSYSVLHSVTGGARAGAWAFKFVYPLTGKSIKRYIKYQ